MKNTVASILTSAFRRLTSSSRSTRDSEISSFTSSGSRLAIPCNGNPKDIPGVGEKFGASIMRPTRGWMFMCMAMEVAQRSTCRRLKVGVILTNPDGTKIAAMGYNGNARGLTNDCDTAQPGACGCIHAEVNALIKAPYDRGELVMYTTHSPCYNCAKLILNSAVTRVRYRYEYRNTSGLALLRSRGILVEQLDPQYQSI